MNPNSVDAIETLLARRYAFKAEQLYFILNYDIKYRIVRGTHGEE
jgi:hypothetical protein